MLGGFGAMAGAEVGGEVGEEIGGELAKQFFAKGSWDSPTGERG